VHGLVALGFADIEDVGRLLEGVEEPLRVWVVRRFQDVRITFRQPLYLRAV
jgi:hypothetical protein